MDADKQCIWLSNIERTRFTKVNICSDSNVANNNGKCKSETDNINKDLVRKYKYDRNNSRVGCFYA